MPTVAATYAGVFAIIDMIAFRLRVITTYVENMFRLCKVELNEIAYSGNQVGEETVG